MNRITEKEQSYVVERKNMMFKQEKDVVEQKENIQKLFNNLDEMIKQNKTTNRRMKEVIKSRLSKNAKK